MKRHPFDLTSFIFGAVFSVGITPLQALYPVEVLSFEMRAKGMAFSSLAVNAGGLLSVLFETGVLDEVGIVARVERIGADLEELLVRAEGEDSPPFRVADRVVAERLAAARAAQAAVRTATPA